MTITTETDTCECGESYTFEVDHTLKEWDRKRPWACAACYEAERQREDERKRGVHQRVADQFLRKFMPHRMYSTERDHAEFNAKLWGFVSKWNPTLEKPWLGLIGPTGRCKTRCAYERVADAVMAYEQMPDFRTFKGEMRENYDVKWSVCSIAAVDFATAVRNQFSDDKDLARGSRDVISKARSSEWLILDDLGKCTHSPAVASAFFALLDYRHNENMATLWTANSAPEQFLSNIPKDIADPMRGRLLECSEIIVVK